jgi:hypothetical protein
MEAVMPDPVEALVLDLLEWIGPQAREYSEVMEAWRTSCPRLTVWEDANERGFIETRSHQDRGILVSVTPLGRALLETHRPHRRALNPPPASRSSRGRPS